MQYHTELSQHLSLPKDRCQTPLNNPQKANPAIKKILIRLCLSLHPHDVRCVFFPDSGNSTHKQRTTTCLHQICNRRPGSPPFPSHTSSPNSKISPALKIEDGTGKHAFIWLGFTERNKAFHFNVALSDHEKYVKREIEKDVDVASDESHINIHPAVNHRLKERETIRITVKNKPASGAVMLSSAGLSEKIKPLSLAPPPEKVKSKRLGLDPPPVDSGKIRSPIPPPPNDPTAVRMTSTTHNIDARNSTDAFTDFSHLKVCPNKHQSEAENFHNGRLLESETYIGGHVDCLETGVFRSDLPTSFKLDSSAFTQLIENLDRDLHYAIKVEGKMDM
ncbi:unnamed protein product [Lactuca virosa]|uniref:DNA polymerase epsilon catalytic subunit n=1 Tax=Lactuca virosa TaxID=75947 RepID=A0AAU9PHR7_9ASTR|nr:unnamed protein product [Lactuca virosa]